MKREVLLTFLFSSRRIWFCFILLTGTVVFIGEIFKQKKKEQGNFENVEVDAYWLLGWNGRWCAPPSISERVRDTKHAWEICFFSYKSRISFFSKPLMAWALLQKISLKKESKDCGHCWVERVCRRLVGPVSLCNASLSPDGTDCVMP